ncbi:putative deubiquitinase DESI2 [Blattamonas nauphoetae]|uniref:Deubiquitinase DESI2 n=1 Tax=Blattamonas nauphoetae TaxID=2049346 RepID=A0ABQ9YBE8_9EUKA|nr:putative deubiquitinase DESI2 [Blattamonas nauphoetae]
MILDLDEPTSFSVWVNIYTLFVKGRELHLPFGWGVYHSGTEIDGEEWAFGGDRIGTGVWSQPPGHSWPGTEFKSRHYVGEAHISRAQLRQIIAQMSREYPSQQYHFCHHNCHDFTEDFINRLCGKDHYPLPKWLNKLARFGSKTSGFVGIFVKSMRKTQPHQPSIQPQALQIPNGMDPLFQPAKLRPTPPPPRVLASTPCFVDNFEDITPNESPDDDDSTSPNSPPSDERISPQPT